MSGWHFEQHDPWRTYRGSSSDAFFAGESDDKPAAALVRESIQNSLGANRGEGPTRVRFAVRRDVSATTMSKWLSQAWPHYLASGINELRESPPLGSVLVVEDFGTCGLEGDVHERRPTHTEAGNHFYRFFWAEALSAKSGQQGGRWGIGKTVFPRSSRIRTFLALTIRSSDQRALLMGRTTLSLRTVDGREYCPDGHFGDLADKYVNPVEDQETIANFVSDFALERASQPGLSIVVPYLTDEIRGREIALAVAQEYFWSILAGRLIVTIEDPETWPSPCVLNEHSLLDVYSKLSDDNQRFEELIYLSQWALSLSGEQYDKLQPILGSPRWSSDLFSSDEAKRLRSKYRRGERIAFSVPLAVTKRGGQQKSTFFKVFLQKDINGRGAVPRFIRNDIFVPKARERAVRGHSIFVLVVVDDEPLAALLGDAEPPAHTKWSHMTEKFLNAGYRYGQPTIQFVCDAPHSLAQFLSDDEKERDSISLADMFPQAPEASDDDLPGPRRSRPTPTPTPDEPTPDVPTPTRAALEIDTIDSGFRIHRGNLDSPRPKRIQIRAAYDRSRGDPWSKYNSADFLVSTLTMQTRGARVLKMAANKIDAELLDDDFEIRVWGFDRNRDVIVRTVIMSDPDAEPGDEDDQAP